MANKHDLEGIVSRVEEALGHEENLTCLFDLLHPITPWEYYLEMEEPAIDAMDPTNPTQSLWIAWYDGLKASQTLLQKTLEDSR
jgi:hypothetical protein